MLKIGTTKVYLNYEISRNQSGILDVFPYAKSNIEIQDLLNNCYIQKTMSLKEMAGKNIYLSPEAFVTFIKQWEEKSIYKKLFSWTCDNWIYTYFQGLLNFAKANKEHLYDEIFMPEEIVIKYIENIQKNFENYTENEIFNIENEIFNPEISWMIESCLYSMLNKKDLEYEDLVNAYIQDNIKRMSEQLSMLNFHSKNPIAKIDLPLNPNITITNIDYYNPNSFFYFYNPFSEERIRSNYLYIKKCLQYYKEQYDSFINPTLF